MKKFLIFLILPFNVFAELGEKFNPKNCLSKPEQYFLPNQYIRANSTVCVTSGLNSELGSIQQEYISSQGFVYAIFIKSINHPDLIKILGNYYIRYQEGLRDINKIRTGKRELFINLDNFILRSFFDEKFYNLFVVLPDVK